MVFIISAGGTPAEKSMTVFIHSSPRLSTNALTNQGEGIKNAPYVGAFALAISAEAYPR